MPAPQITLVVICGTHENQFLKFYNNLIKTQPVEIIELILLTRKNYNYLKLSGNDFAAKKQINYGDGISVYSARFNAIKSASTDYIVFLEDHIELRSDIVSHLIELFSKSDYACIGFTIKPANTKSLISWTGFLVEKCYMGPGIKSGEVFDHMPSNNLAYRKSSIIPYGEKLENYLRIDSLLQWRLLNDKKKLYFTNQVEVYHHQFLSFKNLLKAHFWVGWYYASTRQQIDEWSYKKRILFSFAILLKPIVRWKILLNTPMDKNYYPKNILLKNFFRISLTFILSSIGESFGHLLGAKNSELMIEYYDTGFDKS